MDFTYGDEERALADNVSRYCRRDYDFASRRRASLGEEGFSRRHWAAFADLGWLGAGLPEANGGLGMGPIANAIIMEEFGRALVIEPYFSTAVLALQTLAASPVSALRDVLIEGATGGERLLALAHNEPAMGGGIAPVATHARRSGDDWILDGGKSLIVGAPSADCLMVSAASEEGIGLFTVAPDAPGLRVHPYRLLDNLRVADLRLADVKAAGVLVDPGEAMAAIRAGYDHALVAICAEAIGAMDAALIMTRDYLKIRKQFGTTLNTFQALQHRMADMLIELELSRSILFGGIAAVADEGAGRNKTLSAMKAVISNAALFVGRNAVQLHGGIGMTEDYVIGHYYRKLIVIAGMLGNENFHLERMADDQSPFWSLPFEPTAARR